MTAGKLQLTRSARPSRGRGGARGRGLTLLELVVSMAVTTVLVGGMGSAVLFAMKALPDPESIPAKVVTAADAIEPLATDLAMATAVSSRSTKGFTLVVPDRDSDGQPETISYSWTGTAGDPLVRQLNGRAATMIAEDVREFSLSYDTLSVTRQSGTTLQDSAESTFGLNDGATNLGTATIDGSHGYGQYFVPSLPAAAESWSLTRVRFRARAHLVPLGFTTVEVHPAGSDGVPTADVLFSTTINETTLPLSYSWVDIPITGVTGLRPGDGIAVVLYFGSGVLDSADLEAQSGLTATKNCMIYGNGSSTGWRSDNTKALQFYAYGTVATRVPATASVTCLSGASVALRTGNDAKAKVVSGVQLANQPEVGP